ncbi:MAG: polysaccharide biosynthesis C-terminal domain-containing protein [Pseudomonadota bacterium]|nr:polysaccharide biosynthesis C-terminal domain-containing protein [Pseudomonadota bacterium]
MAGYQSQLDPKFIGDTAWNYGAFALMASTGIILNFFIAARLGIEALGIFNQIYAVYIVTAQLAVFGTHDSAQKYVAEYANDKTTKALITIAAILLAGSFGLVAAIAIFGVSEIIGHLVDSSPVGKGIALAAPGLFLFAINKVLMAVLNGERRMKTFAVAQGARVAVILVSCLIIGMLRMPAHVLGASFTIAELAIFPLLLAVVRPRLRGHFLGNGLADWLARQFRFSVRAVANGFLAESYIRVDIVMLGVFVSDRDVGIYSFAALFSEGLYQVPVVIRTIANPVLVRLVLVRDLLKLSRFVRRVMLFSLGIFFAAAAAVLAIFPYLAPYFPDFLIAKSYSILVILAGGLFIYSAFIPLDFILMQAGMPGRQSSLMTVNVCLNVALNLALIPVYGIQGAASATAISFAFSALTLNLATWRWLKLPGGLLFSGSRWAPIDR